MTRYCLTYNLRLLLLLTLCWSGTLLPAAPAPAFMLRNLRSGESHGPFALQHGNRITLEGTALQLSITRPDRLTFITLPGGQQSAPIQMIEGRLVEIAGRMYAFSRRTATPAAPERPEARPPLVPAAQAPPPRPAPIPIPPLVAPTPEAPRTPFLRQDMEWYLLAWIAPLNDTPYKWRVDGRHGNDFDIKRTTFGGALLWHGWQAELHLSPSVSGKELLPAGMDVVRSKLDDGDGWLLACGYQHPLLRRGGWQVTGSATAQISQDKFDLASTTALGESSSNETVEVSYVTRSSSIKLTEMALRIGLDVAWSSDYWGVNFGANLLPLTSSSISGTIPYGAQNLKLKAERDYPITLYAGGWVGRGAWRLFTDLSLASDKRLRLGSRFDW